ncbi:MAG: arginine deiminase [Acidimicrobiales bacterium]
MALGVHSEVGPLVRVILHEPDLELRRLTPTNKHDLLFDEVLWVQQARRDHAAFAAAVASQGAQVLALADLLAETLSIPAARQWVMDREFGPDDIGAASPAVRALLDALDPAELTRCLIGGLTNDEALALGLSSAESLWLQTLWPRDFVLDPLPNSYFMRDSSCWVYGGAVVGAMAKPVRRREANHLEVIHRWHPLFAGEPFELWRRGEDGSPGSIEGGDVLVIGGGAVLCGVSERTTAPAVEALAARLFAAGQAHVVLAVELPKVRSFMHLDTVVTMADHDAFVVFPGVLDRLRAWRLRPAEGPGELVVEPVADLAGAIAAALGLRAIRVVLTGGNRVDQEREQWDDGNNVLALAPGVVVAYDRNVDTNSMLRREGIEVLTIPGSELSRGRGGPRCMSCPIERGPAR